jgi:hypothetical protein
MTEAEWLACADPQPMLSFLRAITSDRKLRLFAVACVRCIYPRLPDKRTRRNVETVERYADGLASQKALRGAWGSARWAANLASRRSDNVTEGPKWCVAHLTNESLDHALLATWGLEKCQQCQLLRDIYGPLPCRPVFIHPSWLAWNDGTVKKIAQAIYDERAFDRMPILADALEDAGCDDADLLAHCRGAGPHVRGCWVVDLLLGKE